MTQDAHLLTETREDATRPRAHARVYDGPHGSLATVAQLKRLNELGLLVKALAGSDRVTRERAWAVLEEALEQGLWKPARERSSRPDWAPAKGGVE